MRHVWEERKIRVRFRRGNVKESGHLQDLGVDGRILLKRIFNNIGGGGLD
jgi:hypothetical protein